MTQKKYLKRGIAILASMALVTTSLFTGQVSKSQAASKPKLSATKKTMTVGTKTKLKVKKIPSSYKKVKLKWKSSKKTVATVTSKGVVKAKKKGTAKITCTLSYKTKSGKQKKVKLTCKVTVKAKSTSSESQGSPNSTAIPAATASAPIGTVVPTSSVTLPPVVTETPTAQATETPIPEATETPTPEATASPAVSATPTASPDFSSGALEFTQKLGAGINIGNNLEVPRTVEYLAENGYQPSDIPDLYLEGTAGLATETDWNANKPITKSYVQALKDAGFTTVRIPVSYINHTKITTDATGKRIYTLDSVWMNRVKEVVDYAYDIGMYVIINLHHEGNDNCTGDVLNTYGGEASSWLSPLNSTGDAYTAMEERFTSTWNQIATIFNAYDEHLIFADMNEFHHGYNAPLETWCTAQNKLHQAFVDEVRATGGNNVSRYLIVPGYNTNIDSTAEKLEVPVDIEANNIEVGDHVVGHIIVEVHYYSPYTYAADDPEDYVWGSGTSSTHHFADEDYLVAQMELMKTTFIDKGIPVIIGEYGAPVHYSDRTNKVVYEKDEEFRAYFYGSVVKEATLRGISTVAWDNGGENSYCFIDRITDTMRDDADSIVEAIMKYTKDPDAAITKPTE